MNAIELKIRPEANMIPSALAAVKCYAGQIFDDERETGRITLALEEAINNVLSYSLSSRVEYITVTADADGGEFTVTILDDGIPGDFDKILTGEERIGLQLMRGTMDVVTVENLGAGGRRQKLVKYYAKRPAFEDAAPDEGKPPIEKAEITVRSPRREEFRALCREFYDEYGLSYLHDIVYYPDRFYAAVKKDLIHSSVAVDENGNIAGHHAAYQWSNVPGVWESGMAVVNPRYRNMGILRKMMNRTLAYVRDEAKARVFMGCCIALHPYSQLMRIRQGSVHCGYLLNGCPGDSNRIRTSQGNNKYTSFSFFCSV